MTTESDSVLVAARAYSDRIAVRMADTVGQRNDFSSAAFLAYLQGFKHGLAHAQHERAVLMDEFTEATL